MTQGKLQLWIQYHSSGSTRGSGTPASPAWDTLHMFVTSNIWNMVAPLVAILVFEHTCWLFESKSMFRAFDLENMFWLS